MKIFQTLLAIAMLGLVTVRADAADANATAAAPTITCANVRCMSGTHCMLKQVQCIKAPCPPVPTCEPVDSSPSPAPNACTPGFCSDGETCELKQVQCIKAPCPPVPTCVPQKDPPHCCTAKCSANQRCFLYNNVPHCADVCTPSRCGKNERCELQTVQCLVAPCPRVATCLPA